jgi:hypothetical protein
MAPSKKVRELFGPPTNASDKFPFEFAKPNKEMVKFAILLLHAQVKAAREKAAASLRAAVRGSSCGVAQETPTREVICGFSCARL